MQLVHSRKSLKPPILKTLVALLLVTMLVACGTNAANTTSTVKPSSSSNVNRPGTTPTSLSSNSDTTLNLNRANINVTQGDLLIQSRSGFQCPGTRMRSSGILMGQLVLASGRTTYSQNEIAQMRAYVDNDQFLADGGAAPPSTLRWVIGGSMDSIPGSKPLPPGIRSGCQAVLLLTNTGNTPIQVPKVGVQLEARPQQNTYRYRLIDVCSVLPPAERAAIGLCPPTGGGGPGECSVYGASIQLEPGEKNDVFSAVPSATGCSTLTIAPAAQVTLYITFSLAANTPQNLIYSIKPTFTIDTAQGEQTLALSQLGSTFAFASVKQFSCYGLQGTTFVLIPSPTLSPNWCV